MLSPLLAILFIYSIWRRIRLAMHGLQLIFSIKLPFSCKPYPLRPNSSPPPMFKKRKCIKLRAGCTGTYLLFFVAFLLWHQIQTLMISDEDHFYVPTHEFLALNNAGDPTFSNIPMSSFRPKNQFISHDRWSTFGRRPAPEPPILTVITVTRNAREVIKLTARFILEQTLYPIRWLIVNDHTDERRSYQLLQHIASLDGRFCLMNSTLDPGFSNGRIYALKTLLATPTKYFAFLDDDDFFEYTAYEKCLWVLESNVNASMCGTYIKGFGERNYTWEYGFHSGYKIVVNNPLTGSELLRTSVLDTDCIFDKSLRTGMEDWDFYLCLASRGHWGVTIPEYLAWYRINPESLRKTRWGSLFEDREQKSKEIRDRYKELESNFPRVVIDSTTEFDNINLSLPFKNELHLRKSILMIIPWMSNGDGDIGNLRLLQKLSTMGCRVTIVCTLLNLRSNSTASRPLFMQYTHDIFTIPAMMRVADAPRFLAYLIESRNVQKVLISSSQLGYSVLPWLSAKYPEVTFIDLVSSEEPDWKNGGYATYSTIHQASLDATFTLSETVRQNMIQSGHDSSKLEVGNFGIDLNDHHPLQDQNQAAARFKLGIPAKTIVIVLLARTVAFRRAKVATAAFLQVAKDIAGKGAENINSKLRLLIIGDGPAMEEARRISAPVGNLVSLLGNMRHSEALKYLELSDILCLPSPNEDISFVLIEPRKIGLAALTSTISGYPELLIQNTSEEVIVRHSGTSKNDIIALTDKMNTFVSRIRSRKEMSQQKVTSYSQHFGEADDKLSELVSKILSVQRRRKLHRGAHTELPTLHYALSSVLKDVGVFSDFPEIHKRMRGKDYGAYGTRYRAICGERHNHARRILDLLENAKPCVDGEELDIEKMKSNAMAQCWKPCIMNLDDDKLQSGWQAKEKCQGFVTFDDPSHGCSVWYRKFLAKQRN